MANFVYLLDEEESKDAPDVDSGWETQPILAAAQKVGAEGLSEFVSTFG
jgi:hypothetical protein